MRRDRRGTTALEFAICAPLVLLMFFALFAAYTLISTKRAMDYGVEKALRFAAVNSQATVAQIQGAYQAAAASIWTAAGSLTPTVTPNNSQQVGNTVTISVSYNWTGANLGFNGAYSTTLFNPVTLTANATMAVMH